MKPGRMRFWETSVPSNPRPRTGLVAGEPAWFTSRQTIFCVFLLLLLLALLVRWPGLHQPLNRDISAYAAIGARMHHGQWPYRDLFDHKQPLIYAVFWVLAAVAPRSNLAIQLTAALIAGLSGILVFSLLLRLIRFPAALMSSLLLVSLGAARFFEGTDLNTEHLLSAVMCLAVLLPLSFREPIPAWKAMIVGVVAALAILAKAVAVFALPAAVLALFYHRPGQKRGPWRLLGMFAIGLALPGAALFSLYWRGGGLAELLWANVCYNLKYVSAATLHRVGFGAAINSLLAVSMTVATARLVLTRGKDRVCLTILLWLAGAAVGAKIGRGDYAHYFAPILPPAIILACLPVQFTAQNLQRFFVWSRAAAVSLVSIPFIHDLGGAFGLTPAQVGMRMFGEQSLAWNYQEPVGAWLREHSNATDELLVAGAEPGFYWQSGLKPSTRYLYDYAALAVPDFNHRLTEALRARPPRFVVLPEPRHYPYLEWLHTPPYEMAAHYGPIRVLERRAERWDAAPAEPR